MRLLPRIELIEARLTMAPPPPARISGTAILQPRKLEARLTSSTCHQASSLISSTVPKSMMPALLTDVRP